MILSNLSGQQWKILQEELHGLAELERNSRAAEKDRLKCIVPYLAERGWYFYMWLPMSTAKELKRLIDECAHGEAERYMIDLAKSCANEIRQRFRLTGHVAQES